MRQAFLKQNRFTIGHVALLVRTNHEPLMNKLARWMADFAVNNGVSDSENPIRLTLIGMKPDEAFPYRIPASAVKTFANDTARYFDYRGLWLVDFPGTGLLIVNRAANKITGYVRPERLLASLWTLEDVLHPLFELARQQGLYPHHAAGVSYEGRGLLLIGKSGQGKSTLSADLVENGFHFLSDDRCFVRKQGDRYETIGFYEPFKLFASNIRHIPVLHGVEGLSASPDVKNRLDMRSLYPGKVLLSSRLNGLIFPTWAPQEMSRLEPLSPAQALIELLPLTLVCFDAAVSTTHFEFAGTLVRQLPAARMVLGHDRDRWSALIKPFLTSSGRP